MSVLQQSPSGGRQVCWLPMAEIHPNPQQPRKAFDDLRLMELAASIRQHGLLQPISVRPVQAGYEIVMGERRFRACQLLGFTHIDAFVLSANGQETALLALIENLQRENLHYFEEAEAYADLLSQGMSQEMLARRLGKSPSGVANKLRLLKLPREVLEILRDGGATERHARALLCLEDAQLQLQAAQTVVEQHLTVAQTEALTETLLLPPPPDQPARRPRRTFVVKDVRLFLNTVQRGLTLMRTAGVNAQCQREDGEEEILLTIRIPRSPARG